MNKSITITETTRILNRTLIYTVGALFATPYNEMKPIEYILVNRKMYGDEAENANPFDSYDDNQFKTESKTLTMQEFIKEGWNEDYIGVQKLLRDIATTRMHYPDYIG